MSEPGIPVKVAESPADRLRRLSIAPDVPREELWKAIAGAVIDINERLAELEASAAKRVPGMTP